MNSMQHGAPTRQVRSEAEPSGADAVDASGKSAGGEMDRPIAPALVPAANGDVLNGAAAAAGSSRAGIRMGKALRLAGEPTPGGVGLDAVASAAASAAAGACAAAAAAAGAAVAAGAAGERAARMPPPAAAAESAPPPMPTGLPQEPSRRKRNDRLLRRSRLLPRPAVATASSWSRLA